VAKEEYAARAPFYLFILEIHVILAASFFGAARRGARHGKPLFFSWLLRGF
jgi:hypothetical protein